MSLMKAITKHKLYLAWAWCDNEDKSTEFMLQFMADFAGVEYDRVVSFVYESTEAQRNQWYKDNPEWIKEFEITPEEGLGLAELEQNEKDDTIMMLTPQQFQELKNAHANAVAKKAKQFNFLQYVLDTQYAKYLIEWAEEQV